MNQPAVWHTGPLGAAPAHCVLWNALTCSLAEACVFKAWLFRLTVPDGAARNSLSCPGTMPTLPPHLPGGPLPPVSIRLTCASLEHKAPKDLFSSGLFASRTPETHSIGPNAKKR